jgi:hypothetical protein
MTMSPLEITLLSSVLFLSALFVVTLLLSVILTLFMVRHLWKLTEACRKSESEAWAELRRAAIEEAGPPAPAAPERKFADGSSVKSRTDEEGLYEALGKILSTGNDQEGRVLTEYASGNPALPGIPFVGGSNGR